MAPADIVLFIAVLFATIGLIRSFSFDKTLYSEWKTEVDRLRKLLLLEAARRKEEVNILTIDVERERFLRRSLEDTFDTCRRTMAAVTGNDALLQPHKSPLVHKDKRDKVVAILSNMYNMDELTSLMYSIDVLVENIKHDTLSMTARELVWYMERHGRFNELVTAIHKTRPNTIGIIDIGDTNE